MREIGGGKVVGNSRTKPPLPAALFGSGETRPLFQLGRDAREGGVKLGAQAIDHGDDGDRDAGSDQAIFNSGSPRIVLQEGKDLRHVNAPRCGYAGTLVPAV